MVKLLRKTLSLVTRQQSNVLSAASVIMMTVALSRILGLFRDRLLAGRFTPAELGIYYASFRLPNMIFEILVMGSLATAFIPVFTGFLDTKGKEAAFKTASSVINTALVACFILSFPILIFTKQISIILAPGFNDEQLRMMASFTKIMLLAQVIPLIIGNFLTGILQSFRNFLIPAVAPIVYNIGIILAIIFLTPFIGLYAPVLGVVIGAILFLLIQIPATIAFGYKHSWSINLKDKGTREVGKLMLPRTLGLAVSQIDITVDLILSSLLGAGAVTIFNFAQHLQQVPIGLFGASIAQATLPVLASKFAQNKQEEMKSIFTSSFLQILFLVMPFSVILIVLRIPVVRLVFGASNLFDWESTVTTGKTLAFFSISLFAQSLIHLITRGFFAVHDSKTPVMIGAVSVGLNTLLSILFVLHFRLDVWALALATSVANITHMILLLIFFDNKIGKLNWFELTFSSLKIFLAGAVSGVALYIPIKVLDTLVFDTTRTINLLILTGISTTAGISAYFFLAWFLDIPQMSIIFSVFKQARRWQQGMLIDTSPEVT